MASPGSSTGIPRCWELRDASVRATCMGADPLGLEILLLDAGLLVTLYAMWRIVRASRAAVAAMLPWAAVAVGLYGTGEGPFTMTVFTAADRIVAGPVDVSRRTC